MKRKNSFSHFPQRRINLRVVILLSFCFAVANVGFQAAYSHSAVQSPGAEHSSCSDLTSGHGADLLRAQCRQISGRSGYMIEADLPAINNSPSTSAMAGAMSETEPAFEATRNLITQQSGILRRENLICDSATEKSNKNDEQKSSTYEDVVVQKSEFGVVTDHSGPTKDWHLHPVVVIPNLPGIQYAWKIKLKSVNPVFVREEFTLPEAPSSWKIRNGDASSQLLQGGEQCILESFQLTDEGWIGHSWTASSGDPAGKYQIKIWLNGKFADSYSFNVGEPAQDQPLKREGL